MYAPFFNDYPLELPFSINKCIGGPKCPGEIRGLCNRESKLCVISYSTPNPPVAERTIPISILLFSTVIQFVNGCIDGQNEECISPLPCSKCGHATKPWPMGHGSWSSILSLRTRATFQGWWSKRQNNLGLLWLWSSYYQPCTAFLNICSWERNFHFV